jgi:hypothetical protein
MIWALPWAWALAIAAALPLVAHLWSRKRPSTLQFPTLRFLQAASPISRRLHRVQDWPLLLLRIGIVALICAAAAAPTVSLPWRREAWRQRLHRIIVVDAEVAGGSAAAVVAEWQHTAASSTVIGPLRIRDVLDEALAQADVAARRMRTEVVLVFDGSRTAVSAGDVADIPANVGVRLVVVERPPRAPVASAAAEVTVLAPPGAAAIAANMQNAIDRLTLPDATAPIMVGWTGVPPPRSAHSADRLALSVQDGLEAMAADPRVRDAAERSEIDPGTPGVDLHDARVAVLARAPDGQPLLRGWSDDRGLVLDLDALPRSPLTWWAVVSSREALTPLEIDSGQRWNAGDLVRVNREAPLPPDSALPGGLDTRLAWGLALALLVAEQVYRRGRTVPAGHTPQERAGTHSDEATDAA